MSRTDQDRQAAEGVDNALAEPDGRGPTQPGLRTIGEPALLNLRYLAILGARKPPPDLLLPTFDLCRRLREELTPVAGGFQSSLERSCLRLLLRGRQPNLICPARSLMGFRVPPAWADAIRSRRLLIASELPDRWIRPSNRSSELRNDTLTRLAARIFVVSGPPGSHTFERALRIMDAGKAVLCFDHDCNRELLVAGASPVAPRPHRRCQSDDQPVLHWTRVGTAARHAITSDIPRAFPPHALS